MDLSTKYLGLPLRNPVIASASPLSSDLGGIRRLAECGAGAIVLPSLFEEQLRQEHELSERFSLVGADSSPEASSYFPEVSEYKSGASAYLELIAEARAAVDIPVIASLNGSTLSGWIDYASQIEQAGASAIELNIYRIASGRRCRSARPRRIASRWSKPSAPRQACRWRSNFTPISRPSAPSPKASTPQAPTGWCCSIVSTSPISIWRG